MLYYTDIYTGDQINFTANQSVYYRMEAKYFLKNFPVNNPLIDKPDTSFQRKLLEYATLLDIKMTLQHNMGYMLTQEYELSKLAGYDLDVDTNIWKLDEIVSTFLEKIEEAQSGIYNFMWGVENNHLFYIRQYHTMVFIPDTFDDN